MNTRPKAMLALGTIYVVLLVLVASLTPDDLLVEIGTWVLIVMILPANYFPIFYTFAFRWWGGHLGRALFTKALGLALLLNAALFFRFFGEAHWAEEIRFVAYTLVLTGMAYQSGVMTRIRLRAGKRDLAGDRPAQGPQRDIPGVDIH